MNDNRVSCCNFGGWGGDYDKVMTPKEAGRVVEWVKGSLLRAMVTSVDTLKKALTVRNIVVFEAPLSDFSWNKFRLWFGVPSLLIINIALWVVYYIFSKPDAEDPSIQMLWKSMLAFDLVFTAIIGYFIKTLYDDALKSYVEIVSKIEAAEPNREIV